MTLQRLLTVTYSALVIGIIALGVIIILIVNNQEKLNESYTNRFKSYLRADELRQSSDDLTRLARTYVVTGNEKYRQWYNKVLAIRNGEQPRPVNYNRPYWSLVLESGDRPRPAGKTAALRKLMKDLGFTEKEFALLDESQSNSDGLVKTETKAMKLIESLEEGQDTGSEGTASERDTAIDLMFNQQYHQYKKEIMTPITEFFKVLENRTNAEVQSYKDRGNNLLIIALILAGVLVILSATIGILVTRRTQKQIGGDPKEVEKIADKIGDGDLDIQMERKGEKETGIYASMRKMLDALKTKASIIEQIAQKELDVEIEKSSDRDQLGNSLLTMKDALNKAIAQVNTSVEQVNSGADQVSQASQSLSQGATEQASSLEEITSSTNEVNSQSKQNAENATEAHGIAKQATEDAEKGNEQMQQLNETMEKINASSDEINKVVKVIDDIAFQINLLALNANVEAARAGKYGKGFAVVADEVRNLAVKSTDSVKETTQMVEDTVNNIKEGTEAAEATTKQLSSIVEGSGKVANFLEEIAQASREQAQAIEQITEGLDQIDQTTQASTASAEESASASEELAGQAQQLRSMVADFKLDDRYTGGEAQLSKGSHLGNHQAGGQGMATAGGQAGSGRQSQTQQSGGNDRQQTGTQKQQSGGSGRQQTGGQRQHQQGASGQTKAGGGQGRQRTQQSGNENSNNTQETGIKPAKAEDQINLDDQDFDRF